MANEQGGIDLGGIASGLLGNMDEETKINMMNMVGGLMNGGGGDLAGMLGGLMSGGGGDLASSLGPMMGMVTSMLGGGEQSNNLADMFANMTLPTVEEVSTEEETPQ